MKAFPLVAMGVFGGLVCSGATIGSATLWVSPPGGPLTSQSCSAFAGCSEAYGSDVSATSQLGSTGLFGGTSPMISTSAFVSPSLFPTAFASAQGEYDSYNTYFVPGSGTGTITADAYGYESVAAIGGFTLAGTDSFTLGSASYSNILATNPAYALQHITGTFTLGVAFTVGFQIADYSSANNGELDNQTVSADLRNIHFYDSLGHEVSPAASTPEPSSALFLCLGVMGLAAARRLR